MHADGTWSCCLEVGETIFRCGSTPWFSLPEGLDAALRAIGEGRAAPEASRKVYRMGLGGVLVGHGTFGGKPCIALAHAPESRPVGTDAEKYRDMVEQDATLIVVENPQSYAEWVKVMGKAALAAAEEAEEEGKA